MAAVERKSEMGRDEGAKETRIVVVGKECSKNQDLQRALKQFSHPVFYSDSGREYLHSARYETVFVLDDFDSDAYTHLHQKGSKILGPPVVIRCASDNVPLPNTIRPLFCTSMKGMVVCFAGIRRKEKLIHLVDLIHHMGGATRKDIKCTVTHLVANCSGNEKYRFAVSYGIPIMSLDWIYMMWQQRNEINTRDEEFLELKLKPFHRCSVSFYGFAEDEQRHMEELVKENGGICAAVGDDECTHLVVDNQNIKEIPPTVYLPHYVVREEWFWGSIQMEACATEDMYLFEKDDSLLSKSCAGIISTSKARKRKRMKENIAQLMLEVDDSPIWAPKRRSNEIAEIMMNVRKCQDSTGTSVNEELSNVGNVKECTEKRTPNVGKPSPRLQVVMELLQTEKNYVGILHTILNSFKAQIEKPDQYNGPLLAPHDIKNIFGNIPAIHFVHCKMRDRLCEIVCNWREDQSVGDVILHHADMLVKSYPPFVNYFEKSKETITTCDRNNPRFHAFLKLCLSKPECGRQHLTELLIRPVQRLPSIILLLTDIMKHTAKTNPDHMKLDQAIKALKEVMTHINEDKRKTENQVVMFNIINDIESCPATLLSSHRSFVKQLDVIELSDTVVGHGEALSLFVFSDSIEICKRRIKVISAHKSPGHKSSQKSFRHLEMMSLSCVKRVIDFKETEVCRNAFGFVSRNSDCKERLYSFTIESDDVDKMDFLNILCRCTVNTMCRTDYKNFLLTVDGKECNVNTTGISINTPTKAMNALHTLTVLLKQTVSQDGAKKLLESLNLRFRKRVSRAFSFNKTPRKLKRAVSNMASAMSPVVKDGGIYPAKGLTLGSNLTGRRLASSIDLPELDSPLSGIHEDLIGMCDDSDSISLGGCSLEDENEKEGGSATLHKLQSKETTSLS